MRTLLLLVLVVSVGTIAAQTADRDISSLQKTFKKKLLKHSGISDVSYRGCEMTAKLVFQRPSRMGQSGSGGVGGGFPNDEASAVLSAGPGSSVGSVQSIKYVFDLSKADQKRVEILPSGRNDLSIVRLAEGPDLRVSGNFPFTPTFFAVTVPSGVAPEIASLYRELAAGCSASGR